MPKRSNRDIFFDKVPIDGTAIGNSKLIKTLNWDDEKYWNTRDDLLNEGLIARGRGKGGAVYRIQPAETKRTKKGKIKYTKEQSLYAPFIEAIGKGYTKDKGLKSFIIQSTANQGTRKTGGKWTRPDVVVISVKTFSYLPEKYLDIISFEIKPSGDFQVSGVFETASHSRYATKSYLCAHLPDGWEDVDPENERIMAECERFGIGLIYFTDPADYSTFEILIEPIRRNPDPSDMNTFITLQIKEKEKTRLSELLH